MSESHDNPGVIAPPPLVYSAGIVLGFILNALIPLPFVPDGWRFIPGLILSVIGLGIGLWALVVMYRKGTSPVPEHPTTAIVSDGPFGFSRNPIYLGFTLITLGIAVGLNNLWIAFALLLVLPVMHYGVILREERYLTGKFGDAYVQYKARVRRWL